MVTLEQGITNDIVITFTLAGLIMGFGIIYRLILSIRKKKYKTQCGDVNDDREEDLAAAMCKTVFYGVIALASVAAAVSTCSDFASKLVYIFTTAISVLEAYSNLKVTKKWDAELFPNETKR